MPKAEQLKCYYGCVIDGPLHRYPKWDDLNAEKFKKWKSILNPATKAKGNDYIYNNIRLCYRHFEKAYQLPSHRLTKNAVPTLNLFRNDGTVLHSFPNPNKDKKQYLAWVQAVGSSLSSLDPLYVYKNRRLCHAHFEKRYLTWTRRLSPGSVPTLFLPGKQDTKEHSTAKPTVIETSNPTTREENNVKLDPEEVCTAQPTVTDNSNDCFTAEDNIEWVPVQCETAPVESATTAPSARQQFCICCLQQAVPLLSLLTCAHADFLNILMIPQIQPTDRLVCYHCHLMLKKIKKFKRQVQESFKLLSGSSSENSLKQYSNQKRHLTIHETLNLEIPGTNEESPTTDNTKEVPAIRSTHIDRKNKNIEETLKIINKNQYSEDLLSTSTTDNTKEVPAPKSTRKDRKNKNIEETLKIINENQFREDLLSTSTTDNTKEVPAPKSTHKDRKNKNIEEALKIINENQYSEYFDLLSTSLKSVSQSIYIGDIYTDFQSSNTTDFITSRHNDSAVNEDRIDTDGNSKEEVEEEEEYIILDVRERADVQAGAGDALASALVKNRTLSREELSLERAALLSSAPYVRARHRCRSCVVAFAFRDNLADHVRRKHTPPPHNKQAFFTKCRVCRQFVRRDAYNIHRAAHYNRYECVSCAQTFSSYDDAASHYRKQHSSRDTQLKCPRCSFSTTRRRLYKKHSLVCNTRTVSAVR